MNIDNLEVKINFYYDKNQYKTIDEITKKCGMILSKASCA